MVKDNIYLGGASKQIAPFLKKCASKNTPMHPIPRIGLADGK